MNNLNLKFNLKVFNSKFIPVFDKFSSNNANFVFILLQLPLLAHLGYLSIVVDEVVEPTEEKVTR